MRDRSLAISDTTRGRHHSRHRGFFPDALMVWDRHRQRIDRMVLPGLASRAAHPSHHLGWHPDNRSRHPTDHPRADAALERNLLSSHRGQSSAPDGRQNTQQIEGDPHQHDTEPLRDGVATFRRPRSSPDHIIWPTDNLRDCHIENRAIGSHDLVPHTPEAT
jgi:hypothetical protein